MGNIFLEKMHSATEEYEGKVTGLLAHRALGEGIFGFPDKAKSDPCHINYYNEIESITREAADAGLTSEEAGEIAEYLLKAHSQTKCNELTSWMLVTIQKHAVLLIPQLTEKKKAELLAWYCDYVPRFQRLPIQKDVVKALKK